MAITAQVFTLALTKVAKGTTGGMWTNAAGWAGDTIKCALLNSTGAAAVITNRDTYSVWGDVSANELAAGSGYSTGGVTLTTMSIGSVIATHKVPYIGVIPAWTSSSWSAYGAVIYNSTGPAGGATAPLICSIDFGGVQTVASGTFTITADATNGVWNLSAS